MKFLPKICWNCAHSEATGAKSTLIRCPFTDGKLVWGNTGACKNFKWARLQGEKIKSIRKQDNDPDKLYPPPFLNK